MVLQAIKYQRGKLEILDQLRLPHEEVFIDIQTVQHAWDAIHSMQVRGAPAIAIVAALSVAVSLNRSNADGTSHPEERHTYLGPPDMTGSGLIVHNLRFLLTSRPTAVNLGDAVRKLEKVVEAARAIAGATDFDINEAYIRAAEQMLVDDVRDNENIGRFGADWILRHHRFNLIPPVGGKISVITHCNTGSLATAGYGTALGIIRSLHARHQLQRVYYTETRPYNQGSRLTGYELLHDGIPATLITDSMAGALLQSNSRKRGDAEDRIACVVVGADRVAANGDTANKIGTYGLAALARYHDVRFVVAAPWTTIDLATKSGADIPIEERPAIEVTTIKGRPVRRVKREDGGGGMKVEVVGDGAVQEIAVAADLTGAWNPAFDVTGHDLIDCIVTEKGVVEKQEDGEFHLNEAFPSGSV